MAWFKVDDNFYDHPKVDDLSLEAVGVWLLCGTYSARHLTDGLVPTRRAQRMGATETVIGELVDAGLWHEVDDGYQFHNWAEYQPTKGRVEEARAKERERKRKYRRDKAGQYTGQEQDSPDLSQRDNPRTSQRDTPDVSQVESHQPDPTRPDPTRTPKELKESTIADAIERPAETVTADDSDDDLEPRPDIDQILDTIDAHCDHHGFKKPGRTKKNHTAARLMLDRDERPLDEVVDVLRFVTMSDFWPDKIRSAVKLREKYDQLKYQAQRAQTPTTGAPQRMTADQRRLQVGLDREQRIRQGQLGSTLAALEA